MKAKVYFSPIITPENVVAMYNAVGRQLGGKVACKVHSGEPGNQNFLHPQFWKPMIDSVGGTVIECNTAYEGERNSTAKHLKTIALHGWQDFFPFDLMDAEGPDLVVPVENGHFLKENRLGKNIVKYDSMLVLAHFKGHPMGGYGGALKQLSIGCASTAGKSLIHSAGETDDQFEFWKNLPSQERFIKSMADAASTVTRMFDGKLVYILVMANISVDCDCCAVAEDPCVKDVGILASTDPVAIDRAALDIIYNSDDPGKEHFIERVESRQGRIILEAAEELGIGSQEYELINI